MENNLPVQGTNIQKAAKWFKDNFAIRVIKACKNTPFTLDIITSIFLQETAYIIVDWIDKYSVGTILKYSIFDASGDIYSNRRAFPRNSKAFIEEYGEEYYERLIGYSNQMRKMRGYDPRRFLYNGYGLFQYDLQYIKENREFWDNIEWGSFDKCLEKVLLELNRKYKIAGDVATAIRMYNGSGKSAEQYKENVETYIDYVQKIQPNINYVASSSIKQPDIAPIQELIGVSPDGWFGERTEAALKNYQAINNLPQTGIIDNSLLSYI